MSLIIIDGEGYMDISFAIFFFALCMLSIYQTTRKKIYAPFFIVSLVFGFLGGLFSFFYEIFQCTGVNFFQLFRQTFFALQFVFFFLFMEKIRSLKISALRLSFTLSIFTIQVISSIGIVLFSNYPNYSTIYHLLIFLTLFSYNLLAIYVYLIIGVPIYIKIYKYTKENRSLVLVIALVLIGIGFFSAELYQILVFQGFNFILGRLNLLVVFYYALPLIGLYLFLLSYITDVDYLYRLPVDNYLLMILYKSGVTIYSINFKTRFKQVVIDENLLSRLISSINMVFQNALGSQAEVHNILSKDAAIIIESGKFINAAIVTDNASVILQRSLKRYVEIFEKKFHDKLEKEDPLISDFDSVKELLKSIFPFLVIKN